MEFQPISEKHKNRRSEIFTITHRNVSCREILQMKRGFSLKYPSISVAFKQGMKSKMITRRLTNVASPISVYSVEVKAPEGMKVSQTSKVNIQAYQSKFELQNMGNIKEENRNKEDKLCRRAIDMGECSQ